MTRQHELVAPFDRIVIATGADYRWGLGRIVPAVLTSRIGRWPVVVRLMSNSAVRDWFYLRARRPTAGRFVRLARPGQTVMTIGDARLAATSKHGIAGAFEAAFLTGRE
jgi:hypothetical protein